MGNETSRHERVNNAKAAALLASYIVVNRQDTTAEERGGSITISANMNPTVDKHHQDDEHIDNVHHTTSRDVGTSVCSVSIIE